MTVVGTVTAVVSLYLYNGISSKLVYCSWCTGTNGTIVGTNGTIVGTNGTIVGTNGTIVGTNRTIVGTIGTIVGTNRTIVGTNGTIVGSVTAVVPLLTFLMAFQTTTREPCLVDFRIRVLHSEFKHLEQSHAEEIRSIKDELESIK